jgi:hypothetical protein
MWTIKDHKREAKLQFVHEIESSFKVSITLQITKFQPLALMSHFNLQACYFMIHESNENSHVVRNNEDIVNT